jgi:hypothetical protein
MTALIMAFFKREREPRSFTYKNKESSVALEAHATLLLTHNIAVAPFCGGRFTLMTMKVLLSPFSDAKNEEK